MERQENLPTSIGITLKNSCCKSFVLLKENGNKRGRGVFPENELVQSQEHSTFIQYLKRQTHTNELAELVVMAPPSSLHPSFLLPLPSLLIAKETTGWD